VTSLNVARIFFSLHTVGLIEKFNRRLGRRSVDNAGDLDYASTCQLHSLLAVDLISLVKLQLYLLKTSPTSRLN